MLVSLKVRMIGAARKMKPMIKLIRGHSKKNPGHPRERGRPGSVESA
jgi:hypothetical protein